MGKKRRALARPNKFSARNKILTGTTPLLTSAFETTPEATTETVTPEQAAAAFREAHPVIDEVEAEPAEVAIAAPTEEEVWPEENYEAVVETPRALVYSLKNTKAQLIEAATELGHTGQLTKHTKAQLLALIESTEAE